MPILDWLSRIYDSSGLNLSIVSDAYDRKNFIDGFIVTLELAGLSLVLSLLIGIIGAWASGSKSRAARLLVSAYIQWFRNTPTIIQLYLFYFGLGSLLTSVDSNGISIPIVSGFTWAVFCLSMYYGAFNAEVIRAGIETVPLATTEAAESLGYSRWRAFFHIILPLSFRLAFPALNNNFVNLIKATSLAYAIAVPEMLYVSSQIWANSLNTTEMMNILLLSYVSIVGIFVWAMGRVERHLRIPGVGQ